MSGDGGVDVYLGLDVGKGEHHATALTPEGKKVFDKRLPNTEPKPREVFAKLQAKHGTVLLVVDQPASIGALPLAVARDTGCRVAYLPSLTMRQIADLYPGEAKTDARDAYVIADAARTMPHTLRAVEAADETVAELDMLTGFDDDLAAEVTRTKNRLRGLLTQIHPPLEKVLGPRLDHPAVLTLLERFGSPAQLRKAGRRKLVTLLRPKAQRMAERLVEDVFTALDEQTVVVPGTDTAALIIPGLVSSLGSVLDQRRLLAARIEELLEAHPLSPGPDFHARHRSQDRRPDPHRRRRRQGLRHGRTPDRLRRPGASHPRFRLPHPRRTPCPARQQAAQTCLLPRRVRLALTAGVTGLLRQKAPRGEAPCGSSDRPRPTTHRRTFRHAPRRHLLRSPDPHRGLTNTIGALLP